MKRLESGETSRPGSDKLGTWLQVRQLLEAGSDEQVAEAATAELLQVFGGFQGLLCLLASNKDLLTHSELKRLQQSLHRNWRLKSATASATEEAVDSSSISGTELKSCILSNDSLNCGSGHLPTQHLAIECRSKWESQTASAMQSDTGTGLSEAPMSATPSASIAESVPLETDEDNDVANDSSNALLSDAPIVGAIIDEGDNDCDSDCQMVDCIPLPRRRPSMDWTMATAFDKYDANESEMNSVQIDIGSAKKRRFSLSKLPEDVLCYALTFLELRSLLRVEVVSRRLCYLARFPNACFELHESDSSRMAAYFGALTVRSRRNAAWTRRHAEHRRMLQNNWAKAFSQTPVSSRKRKRSQMLANASFGQTLPRLFWDSTATHLAKRRRMLPPILGMSPYLASSPPTAMVNLMPSPPTAMSSLMPPPPMNNFIDLTTPSSMLTDAGTHNVHGYDLSGFYDEDDDSQSLATTLRAADTRTPAERTSLAHMHSATGRRLKSGKRRPTQQWKADTTKHSVLPAFRRISGNVWLDTFRFAKVSRLALCLDRGAAESARQQSGSGPLDKVRLLRDAQYGAGSNECVYGCGLLNLLRRLQRPHLDASANWQQPAACELSPLKHLKHLKLLRSASRASLPRMLESSEFRGLFPFCPNLESAHLSGFYTTAAPTASEQSEAVFDCAEHLRRCLCCVPQDLSYRYSANGLQTSCRALYCRFPLALVAGMCFSEFLQRSAALSTDVDAFTLRQAVAAHRWQRTERGAAIALRPSSVLSFALSRVLNPQLSALTMVNSTLDRDSVKYLFMCDKLDIHSVVVDYKAFASSKGSDVHGFIAFLDVVYNHLAFFSLCSCQKERFHAMAGRSEHHSASGRVLRDEVVDKSKQAFELWRYIAKELAIETSGHCRCHSQKPQTAAPKWESALKPLRHAALVKGGTFKDARHFTFTVPLQKYLVLKNLRTLESIHLRFSRSFCNAPHKSHKTAAAAHSSDSDSVIPVNPVLAQKCGAASVWRPQVTGSEQLDVRNWYGADLPTIKELCIVSPQKQFPPAAMNGRFIRCSQLRRLSLKFDSCAEQCRLLDFLDSMQVTVNGGVVEFLQLYFHNKNEHRPVHDALGDLLKYADKYFGRFAPKSFPKRVRGKGLGLVVGLDEDCCDDCDSVETAPRMHLRVVLRLDNCKVFERVAYALVALAERIDCFPRLVKLAFKLEWKASTVRVPDSGQGIAAELREDLKRLRFEDGSNDWRFWHSHSSKEFQRCGFHNYGHTPPNSEWDCSCVHCRVRIL